MIVCFIVVVFLYEKVRFNPIGNLLLSASADKSARVWFTETGTCSQVLSGHTDEVISCEFSYPGEIQYFEYKAKIILSNQYLGNAILTASKDNTCKIWR